MVIINHAALTIKNNHHKCITKFQINIQVYMEAKWASINLHSFLEIRSLSCVFHFALCLCMKK